VDHRVGPELLAQPGVRREVVVARRQVRVVVDRNRVLAETARRLDHQHDIAVLQGGQHDLVAVDVQPSRRRAPVLDHPLTQLLGQRGEPRLVRRQRHPRDRGSQLVLRQPLDVVPAGRDQGVHELVAILGP